MEKWSTIFSYVLTDYGTPITDHRTPNTNKPNTVHRKLMKDQNNLKKEIIDKIDHLPLNRLREVYEYLKNIETVHSQKGNFLSFAGIWSDMPEKEFKELTENIEKRRKNRENRFDAGSTN